LGGGVRAHPRHPAGARPRAGGRGRPVGGRGRERSRGRRRRGRSARRGRKTGPGRSAMTWDGGMPGNDPASLRRSGEERKIQLGNSAKTLDNMQSERPRYALRFISGKYQGGEFPLRMNREIIIGRSSDLDMVLVEDMVSRKHAKISTTDSEVYIQ